MKYIISYLTAILFIAGCAGSEEMSITNKYITPNSKLNFNKGYLKIYTYKFDEKIEEIDNASINMYKGYTIYNNSGNLVLDIPDSPSSPFVAKLNEGNYVVVAEFQKGLLSSFNVKIEKGKVVEIDKSMILATN